MPMPAELERLVRERINGTFNPAHTRQEWADYKDVWREYLDFLELDSAKIGAMLDMHGGETKEKYAHRQALAACFNLIPTIVNMIRGYIFYEPPQIDVGADDALQSFLANADGNQTGYADWVRTRALPLALALGWVDVLVQNPFGADEFSSVKAAREAGVAPTVYTVTPLKRLNWAANPNDSYIWLTFLDEQRENPNPFISAARPSLSYITVGQGGIGEGFPDTSFWVRTWQEPTGGEVAGEPVLRWMMDGDYMPTVRVPVATLYYQKSIDPDRRHWGVSKLSMMAVLTRLMIQVMSWTMEDIEANLALIAMPSRGGVAPKDPADPKGTRVYTPTLTPFTFLWYDSEHGTPIVVQGQVDHIKVKMELVSALVTEILRLANLLAATGTAKVETSGVAGMVNRTELFQELSEISAQLDGFTVEVLALVKSAASGEDVTADEMRGDNGPKVNFYKGPWMMDPLADLIANTESVVGMFRTVSPDMAEAAYAMLARAFLPQGDPAVKKVLEQIRKNTGRELQEQAEADKLLRDSEAQAAANAAAVGPAEGAEA